MRTLYFFVCAITCIAVSGCEQNIHGQIFVVTRGAGAYKMALVPVYGLELRDMDRLRSEWLSVVDLRIAEARSEDERRREEYVKADLDLDAFKKDALRPAHEALVSYTGFTEYAFADKQSGFTDDNPFGKINLDRDALQAEWTARDRVNFVDFTAPDEIPKKLVSLTYDALVDGNDSHPLVPDPIFQKLRDHLTENTDSGDPGRLTGELLEIANTYSQEWIRLHRDLSASKSAAEDRQRLVDERRQAYGIASQALATAELVKSQPASEEVVRWLRSFLVGLDNQTKTDADGDFTIGTASPVKYLIAYGERLVGGDKTETYLWAIDVEDSEHRAAGKIVLSSDNLMTPEEFFAVYLRSR